MFHFRFIMGVIYFYLLGFLSTSSFSFAQDSVVESLKNSYQKTAVGAVAFVLVEHGKVVHAGGFGHYSNQDNKPVNEFSLFRVGSITKTFTAIAVMQQVEKDKLKLSQSIQSVVKDIPLTNPYKQTPVTLEMLLEHTSGLEDLNRLEFNYPKPLNLKNAFKLAPEARLIKSPPGYLYNYSNAGAGYLGRAIEVVNGVDYDQWFETEILKKMAMNDSSLKWSQAIESQLVSGYDADLKTKIPYWHTLFRPFAGLNTTAMDMSKLLIMLTQNRESNWEQIITPKSLQRMETPTTSLAAKSGLKTGYGLAIRNVIYKGHRLYGHGGDGDGYLAQFSYSHQSGRGYFYVINAYRYDIDQQFSELLNNWLIEGLEKPKISSNKISLAPAQINQLLGEYHPITTRFSGRKLSRWESITIRQHKSVLQICNSQHCNDLISLSESLFRIKEQAEASISITKAKDGNRYLQYQTENFMQLK